MEATLIDREKALSNVTKEKEEVTAAAKKTKEDMEGKVRPWRSFAWPGAGLLAQLVCGTVWGGVRRKA